MLPVPKLPVVALTLPRVETPVALIFGTESWFAVKTVTPPIS